MRSYQINQSTDTLPKLGLLTQVDELSRFDMIYAYGQIKKGTRLELKQDENRPWDRNAILVYFKGFKLGYISKKSSAMVNRLLNKGEQILTTVKSVEKKNIYNPIAELDIAIHVL